MTRNRGEGAGLNLGIERSEAPASGSRAYGAVRAALLLLLGTGWGVPPVAAAIAPTVSKVQAQQRPGTQWVEITYDLSDPDSSGLTLSLAVSDNGGASFAVPATSFVAGSDLGVGVAPGKRKRILWDAGKDWPNRFSSNMRFRVTATDSDEPPNPDPARLVWVPPGRFTMGSPPTEEARFSNEGPETTVTLTRGFWIGRREVTQREFTEVMGANPSHFQGDLERPVEQVTWNEAVSYCARLSVRERAAGRLPAGWVYRLPTEAQWENACRAGTRTRFSYGNDPGYVSLREYAWYGHPNGNSGGTTHPVGTRRPNAWGLYDMHGNVWEFCQDTYGQLPGGSVIDPVGSTSTSPERVIRGGGWVSDGGGHYCRSAVRYMFSESARNYEVGFRVAVIAVP